MWGRKLKLSLKQKLQALFRGKWLRGHWLHRIFGRYLAAKDLWRLNRRSLAGGVALGLFIAFTPTIPFQMALAALGVIYFRVNLPIALAACWVTNPVTAVPIYISAWRLGWWVLRRVDWVSDLIDIHLDSRMAAMLFNSLGLWIGSLIYAASAAIVSYVLIMWFWKEIELHIVPLLSHHRDSQGSND